MKRAVAGLLAAVSVLLCGGLYAAFPKEQLRDKRVMNIIVILDCSASMNKIIGPVRKTDIARKVVETILEGMYQDSHDAGSMKSGLRVFGSKFFKWKQNCDDTSLEVALDDIEKTRPPINDKISTIVAKGQSSLSLTIDALKGDFPEENDKANFIVVVSDGDESCGGSPCDAVRQLIADSRGVSVNTIGVETDQAGLDNLNCMAQAGNGRYFDSKDVQEFVNFLKDANRTIQSNRRSLALNEAKNDTSTIRMRDVTESMTLYKVEAATPLYPDRDERFAALDTLHPEDRLFLISSRGLWKEIFVPDKKLQGWVLAMTGGSQSSVTVSDAKTPLYTEKSPSSEVLTYLDAGEQLTVLKQEGTWYQVFSQKLNLRGWVIAFNVAENR
ncbi:VWA domain-containing protein [bacterium]|nr:VWA domain-containing protein [bacterium]